MSYGNQQNEVKKKLNSLCSSLCLQLETEISRLRNLWIQSKEIDKISGHANYLIDASIEEALVRLGVALKYAEIEKEENENKNKWKI